LRELLSGDYDGIADSRLIALQPMTGALLSTLVNEIGVRQCGTEAARMASDAIVAAFMELGLETHVQEFPLLRYDAEEPELLVSGERWTVGPCMYAHPQASASVALKTLPTGLGLLARAGSFALYLERGRSRSRLEGRLAAMWRLVRRHFSRGKTTRV
jgi:hypothetical protein